MRLAMTGAAVLVLAAAAGAQTFDAPKLFEVAADKLNVRADHAKDARIVKVLKRHQALKVVAKWGPTGNWKQIVSPVKGWVHKDYVRYGLKRYVVKTDSLNVRRAPSKTAGIKSHLKKGTEVRVVEKKDNWRRIDQPTTGWVHADYLSSAKPGVDLGPKSRAGFVNLPGSGYGYASNTSAYRRWGTPRMVLGLIAMGRKWKDGYPGPKGHYLVYSDISLENGGYFSPHVSHRLGVDVDMSPITTSVNGGYTYVGASNYSTYYNTKFARLQRSVWSVNLMLHNNSRIPGTTYWSGHANHFHTRIN